MLIFCLAAQLALATPALEEVIEQTYAVGPKPTLSIQNTDGTIYVYASDQNEIKITARKRAYTKQRLESISVKVVAQSESITIETTYPPKREGLSLADRSGTVDYLILVPPGCAISKAELANGEIILEGLHGSSVNARLGNGILSARNCFSPTNVTLASGVIDLFFGWWEESAFSLSAANGNGDVRVALPPKPDVSLDASTENGQVRNGFAKEAEKKGNVRSVQTVIGDGIGAAFQLRATNGNIRIEQAY